MNICIKSILKTAPTYKYKHITIIVCMFVWMHITIIIHDCYDERNSFCQYMHDHSICILRRQYIRWWTDLLSGDTSRKSINLFLKYCVFLNMMIPMIAMIMMITMPMMTNISTTSLPSAFADGSHAGFSQWSSQLYLLWKPLPSLFTFLLQCCSSVSDD